MHCKKCQIQVTGHAQRCPLCGGVLIGTAEGESAFPQMRALKKRDWFLLRLALVLTAVAAVTSVLVNVSTHQPGGRWWSLFVLAGLLSLWCAVGIAVYKRRNLLKMIMWQVLLLGGLSIAWDLLTGFHRWSFNFVIPILCTLAMIAITLLARIMKQELRDYLVYLLISIIFCLSSAILILCGVLTIPLPAYLCLGTSLLALTAVIILHGRTFFSELKRRFHL